MFQWKTPKTMKTKKSPGIYLDHSFRMRSALRERSFPGYVNMINLISYGEKIKKCFIRFIFLAAGFHAFCSFSFPQSVVYRNGEAVIDLSKIFWAKGGLYKTFIPEEKNPDQEQLLGVELSGSDKKITISGKISDDFLQAIQKINSSWNQAAFWIKPDGSGESVTLVFHSKNESGKLIYSSHIIKLIGSEWQKIEIKSLWHSDKIIGLQLKNLINISFYATVNKKISFYISPIHFKLKGDAVLNPVKVFSAYTASTAPNIDGKLNDQCWENAAVINTFARPYGNEPVPAVIKICFDKKNIFIALRQTVDTTTLKKEQTNPDGTVWADDCFEFFISPGDDNRTWHQLVINALNVQQSYHNYFDQVKDGFIRDKNKFINQWKSAVNIENNFWGIEICIPRNLEKGFEKNLHGMQISVSRTGAWTDAQKNIDPAQFGILYLDEGTESAPEDCLKDIFLNFENKTPALTFKIQPADKEYNLYAQISTPEGSMASLSALTKDKIFTFNGYIPRSGIQRLVLLLNNGSSRSLLYAFKTAPMVFSVKIPYGNIVLTPMPKKLLKGNNSYQVNVKSRIFIKTKNDADTLRSAIRLQNNFLGYLQADLLINEESEIPENTIIVGESSAFTKQLIGKILHKDGYILDINEQSILLTGNTGAGLLYAIITLSQLERYSFLKNSRALPCAYIEDWPSLSTRAWVNWSDILYSTYNEKTKGVDSSAEILASYYDYLERLALGTKMNLFSWMNPTSIRYENRNAARFTDKNAYMTIHDLAGMADYCQNIFIKFVPGLHGPSHANWLTSKLPELILPGYNNYDADPVHTSFFENYFLIQNELIKAAKPDYFHTMNDEWWHKATGEVSLNHAGQNKRDIFLNTILKIHNSLTNRGIQMMMHSDMLQQSCNGGKPFDNYLNLEKMPRDIIMLHWNGDEAAVNQFGELGFNSWYTDNRYTELSAKKIKNHNFLSGIGVVNYDSLTPDFGYGPAGMIKTADLAWNFWNGDLMNMDDWLNQNGANIMAMLSVRPNPAASHEFIMLDISAVCNDSYYKSISGLAITGLPKGETIMGFIPAKIIPADKGHCVIRGEETAITIPVRQTASSFIFFHTQYCPVEKQKAFLSAGSLRKCGTVNGQKTGRYIIHFQDGEQIPVYMRNSVNCGNWLPLPGRVTSILDNKYLIDARYIWESNEDDQNTCVYQYEWVNPRPNISINTIEFSSMGTYAIPYLLALTVRKIKQ